MYGHKHPEPTAPCVGPAIVYLIVGLPGAGKTYHAKELEMSASALRITPDEWQILVWRSKPTRYAGASNLRGKFTLSRR